MLLARTAWCCSVVIGWMTAGPRVIFTKPRPQHPVRARLLPLLHLSVVYHTVSSSSRSTHQLLLSIWTIMSYIGCTARDHHTARGCSRLNEIPAQCLTQLHVEPKSWTQEGKLQFSIYSILKESIICQFSMQHRMRRESIVWNIAGYHEHLITTKE
jgi:hypothetical protein